MFRIRPTLIAAVQNNAAWVAAMHAVHGHTGEWGADLWLTRAAGLPLYPNAVTLTPDGLLAQTVKLRALVAAGLPAGWSIKDSYANLDLKPLGFEPLFEAQWYARPPEGGNGAAGVRWSKVSDPAGLAAWEQAWRSRAGNAMAVAPLFTPALLADPNLTFLAGRTGEAADAPIVAGLIAHHTGAGESEVVGLGNIFLPEEGGEALRPGALAAAEAAYPGLPLVGYDHGAELEAMWAQGFVVLGPLRIWTFSSGNLA